MNGQNYFYIIPAILAESGKPQKALLYGLITSLTRKDGICTATNEYLAKKLKRKDLSTIRQYVSEMEKDGWLLINNRDSKKREIKLAINARKNPAQREEKTSGQREEKTAPYIESKINNSNIKSINIAPASGADGEVIPDLLKDKKKHIQIIGYLALAKSVNFESVKHQQTFIKRHTRAAADLSCYDMERIKNVMRWLFKNTTLKWTLETVGKYIDEDLNRLKDDKHSQDVGYLHDGTLVIKKFGQWQLPGRPEMNIDPEYYPEVAKDEVSPTNPKIKDLIN